MLKNYLKTSLRNIFKHRVSSMAKIFALAIGMASCIIIFSLIKYESSFDDFHKNTSRIYRVNLIRLNSLDRVYNGNNFYPLGEAIRSEITGVESATSVHCERSYSFKYRDNFFQGRFAFFVDNEYPKIFDVTWLVGDSRTSLKQANTAVVTKEFAVNFLGGTDQALNKVVTFNGKLDLLITGVVADPPSNTDHPYSILISYTSLDTYLPQKAHSWELVERGATYVLLGNNTNIGEVANQINRLIPKYLNKESAQQTSFSLMGLGDLHDNNGNYNNYNYEFPLPLMLILSVLAVAILLASCMNYINLATAEGIARANEVGVRKTFGAQRLQLAIQFLSETFMVTSFSLALSFVVAKFGMTALMPILRTNALRLDFFGGADFFIVFVIMAIVVSFLSGLYPSLILSKMKPISALHNGYAKGSSRGRMRKFLIIIQFTVVQILILATFIQLNQISFLKRKPLGYDNQNVLSWNMPKSKSDHSMFMTGLSSMAGVLSVTCESEHLQEPISLGEDNNVALLAVTYEADENIVNTFGFELIFGKGFTVQSKHGEVVVNETLLRHLGIQNADHAVGRVILVNDKVATIVGVVKDFYPKGGLSRAEPVVFKFAPQGQNASIVFARLANTNIQATLAKIEGLWHRVYPDDLYTFIFLDDWYELQYSKFDTFLTFLYIFCGLALLIGGLGLYSFITFISNQRTKEIGIRKILGASGKTIVWMINRDIVKMISIAFVFAGIISYYLMSFILQEFAEQEPIGIWVFVSEFAFILLIAILITISKSVSAANSNPTASLRTH